MKKVDTFETERGQSETGLARKRKRDRRRLYSASHKRAIVAQRLQPGVSVAAITLSHGINANLVRKWIVKHQPGAAATKWAADAPAAPLPVTVDAVATLPTARHAVPRRLIVLELKGVPIELAGAVDEQALRMVVRMIADSAAR